MDIVNTQYQEVESSLSFIDKVSFVYPRPTHILSFTYADPDTQITTIMTTSGYKSILTDF